jgi:hypothetical protein
MREGDSSWNPLLLMVAKESKLILIKSLLGVIISTNRI